MTAPAAKGPTATLFFQIFALVLLSLLIAQIINVLVIFRLPRPTPDYYTAAEIAQAFQRGPGAATHEGADARALNVTTTSRPAAVGDDDPHRFQRLRGEVADILGVDSGRLRVVVDDPRFIDRQSIIDIRHRLERGGQRETPFVLAPFTVSLARADGRWLVVRPPQPAFPNAWQLRIILWFVITAVAMAPMAWWFARRLSSSVTLFAQAAERLGRDPNAPPLENRGPSEIAPAIIAFNQMQDRLRRYVVDRTAMAAAMAHDLRTPLTRLRFRVESVPAEAAAKMAGDIDEMEAMIAASLAYVRDSRGPAKHTPLELSSLLESLVVDMAETGAKVTVDRADRIVLEGDPMGLRRMLTNLLENACNFGGGARSRLFERDGFAVIEVEDDGPGVPEAELEKVFEPFYRAEPSRSRKTGGSGLGLAAARSIARAHGGDAALRNRPQGGLIAEVRLPV